MYFSAISLFQTLDEHLHSSGINQLQRVWKTLHPTCACAAPSAYLHIEIRKQDKVFLF